MLIFKFSNIIHVLLCFFLNTNSWILDEYSKKNLTNLFVIFGPFLKKLLSYTLKMHEYYVRDNSCVIATCFKLIEWCKKFITHRHKREPGFK